jgi:hypothetical protein
MLLFLYEGNQLGVKSLDARLEGSDVGSRKGSILD